MGEGKNHCNTGEGLGKKRSRNSRSQERVCASFVRNGSR